MSGYLELDVSGCVTGTLRGYNWATDSDASHNIIGACARVARL